MTEYYAKTSKIHKLTYHSDGIHILECGGVSEGGGVYQDIDEDKFDKCQVCFYDEFN